MLDRVRKTVDWGYILEAPGRPKLKEQREFMRAAGISMAKFAPIWHDKIERGSTRPQKQLLDRGLLLQAVDPGDTVHIAAEFCVGVSENDARWFIHALVDHGVNLRVAGKDIKVGCIEEVVEEVGRRQNTLSVRTFREAERLRAQRRTRIQRAPEPAKVTAEKPVSWAKRPCVYRHFDIEGGLLYIGACKNYKTRMQNHKCGSPWFSQIHREAVDFYETLAEAKAVERKAIWLEKPMYNRQRYLPPTKVVLEEAAKLVSDDELAERILKLSD